jgi:Transposase IS66 family
MDLKAYKQIPTQGVKKQIENQFDALVKKKTTYMTLNLILKRMGLNKKELLLVLDRPEIPLHNNLSENDTREYMKKRKISGSTRSDEGRQCRDTFTSLKKTCNKLSIRFWDYLIDRLSITNIIPSLGSFGGTKSRFCCMVS